MAGLTVQDLLDVLKGKTCVDWTLNEILAGIREGGRQGQLQGHKLELDEKLHAAMLLDPRLGNVKLQDLRQMAPALVIGSGTMNMASSSAAGSVAPPAAVARGGHPNKIKDAQLRAMGWEYEGGDGGGNDGNDEMRNMMMEMMKMMTEMMAMMRMIADFHYAGPPSPAQAPAPAPPTPTPAAPQPQVLAPAQSAVMGHQPQFPWEALEADGRVTCRTCVRCCGFVLYDINVLYIYMLYVCFCL